ncbi:MAG: thioredoxin family protein [Candidatus Diapherotrites archaeon]|nr:thioredoxin family protein [Candidatus Diapherotrites archaeon]
MTLMFSSDEKLRTENPAPEFLLPATDGKKYSLKDFGGKKAVAVVFMCNHCPFVQPKFEYFVQLQEKYGPKGFQLIGINSNDTENYPEDSMEKMKGYAKRFRFNFPYLFDETQEVAKAYGATCTPDPFLFDSEFRLAYHGRLDNAHREPHSKATTHEFEDAVQRALDGKPVNGKVNPSQGCNIKWKA